MKTPVADEIMKVDSLSLVIPSLLVKRECLCIEGTICTEDLSLSLLPHNTPRSFWVNALSNCVLLLEDASDNS